MSLVELENFYGRGEILNHFKRRFLDFKDGYRQNVALISSRYAGKSALLKKFITTIEDNDVLPVYIDLENKDFLYIANKLTGNLLYYYALSEKLPAQEEIALLMESLKSRLPLTVKAAGRVQNFLSHYKFTEACRELFAFPQIFTKESGKSCVLLLDEFHHLENLDIPGVFQELGKNIMTQKQCLYIVTSSEPLTAKNILSEKLSLLFGDFEVIDLASLSMESSSQLVKSELGEVKISDQLVEFLFDFTGGHPFWLRLLSSELAQLSAIHKQQEVFIPLMATAIENLLFNKWGSINTHFELIISETSHCKDQHLMAKILIALANGRQKTKELSHEIGYKQNVLKQKLNRLVETGIVIKNGQIFYIQDRLFKYWARFVYQKRYKVNDFQLDVHRNRFRADLQQTIESFMNTLHKQLPERVADLLYCFEEESYRINGRRYKLPQIQDVTQKKIRKASGGYFDVIKAATSEGEWFIALKSDTVDESDIAAISVEAKKGAQKPQRCVLISLAELDENTRVRALQERMWIWNKNELNTLLNLYDKPYIVR